MVSVSSHLGWYDSYPDAYELIHNVWTINIGLLIFNMMPVYPLDGGQILRSLLWFPLGRAKSLLAASITGFIGLAGLLVLTAIVCLGDNDYKNGSLLALMSFFMFLSAGACPNCPAQFTVTQCLDCGTAAPLPTWTAENSRPA